MSPLKIGVVGGGVMGKTLSFLAHQRGHQVTLFDENSPEDKKSCSQVAAGMLSPFCELVDTGPLISYLGERGIELWQSMVSHLGTSVYFQKKGTIVLSHFRDSGLLREFKSKIERKVEGRNGLIENWERRQLVENVPGISSEFKEALYLPFEGQIDPQTFHRAFYDHFSGHLNLLTGIPAEIISSQRVTRNGQSFYFDKVIDCRGLKAKEDLTGLRGVRGELLVLEAPEVELPAPIRFLHPRYPLYLVPRPNGKILMGATTLEEEDFSPVSVRSMMEFLSAAYCLDKKFAEARILEARVQCRPGFGNNHPKIVLEKGTLRVNGLYRHGHLISPSLSEMVLDYLEGKRLDHHWDQIFEERA